MSIVLSIIIGLFGLLFGFASTGFNQAQQQGRDTVRISDINSIFQKLEEHYNSEGDYPTLSQLQDQGVDVLPGLDPAALTDENDTPIWEPNSEYYYAPDQCSAIGCQSYEVGTLLEDGETYSKKSLN